MRLLLHRASGAGIVMVVMGATFLWLLTRNPNEPITKRYSTEPLPHQGFARVVFYIAGITLVLGGLWTLWSDLHASP